MTAHDDLPPSDRQIEGVLAAAEQLIADSEELAQLKGALTWLTLTDDPQEAVRVVLDFAKSLGWKP